jgi:hypothetical protein
VKINSASPAGTFQQPREFLSGTRYPKRSGSAAILPAPIKNKEAKNKLNLGAKSGSSIFQI